MTNLERLAVRLHDHLWANMGIGDEWTMSLGGDDKEVTEFIEILNALQTEIKAQGFQTCEYNPSRFK
jgi:hypothetical protein